ncbi:MAG: AtpZ/AtpI family protein [Velocimicrobium sp.]
MKNNRGIWKSLIMITQIGLSMITPIFLCVFIGVKMDQWLSTSFWFFIWLFFGLLSAFRSVYMLTKKFYSKDLKEEIEEQKYFENLKKDRNKKGK